MARPKKSDGDAREKLMQVRVRPADYIEFKEAADTAGLDLSSWVRAKLKEAVAKDRRKYT